MRLALLTLLMFTTLNVDAAVTLWVLALLPLLAAVTLLALLPGAEPDRGRHWRAPGTPGRSRPPEWAPMHTAAAMGRGRHNPGPGRWRAPLADRIGEDTAVMGKLERQEG